MQKGNHLSAILRSSKTVFTTKDIALLWHEPVTSATRVRLNYYLRKGDLYRIRKGLYAKSRDYDKLELATRIFTPSYVSFETVLVKEGLIFQYYGKIFAASYITREITVDQQTYSYRKIKDQVLTNPTGVEHVNETSIATKERAYLDALYVYADYHLDNLRSLNWERVFETLPIYNNQQMARKVTSAYKATRKQGAAPMTTPYIIVLITTPSEAVGRQLAEALLAGKLAACVNIIPRVDSFYAWKGEIQNDQEALLVVKSRLDLFEDRLVPAVKALHPYEVPEIIALPILMGSKSYLDWIGEETLPG